MKLESVVVGDHPPDDVNVVVEVPFGGEPIKYEMNKKAEALVVDRFLYTAMRYPGNYGFIPHTPSDNGDPVDVIVADNSAIVPGVIVNCRVVGVLFMEDEAGRDEKIVAVPSPKLTPRYSDFETYTDLPEVTLRQIEHFFQRYKDLEPGQWTRVLRCGDAVEARASVVRAIGGAAEQGA